MRERASLNCSRKTLSVGQLLPIVSLLDQAYISLPPRALAILSSPKTGQKLGQELACISSLPVMFVVS